MGVHKLIQSPEKEFDLPLKKANNGNYIVVPKQRGYSGVTIVNKKKNPNGYIYFIRGFETNFYKIGVSNHASRRIKDIDSYMPFDLCILSLHYFEGVYDIEDIIKEKLKPFHLRKEWYSLNIDVAKDIMIYLHNLQVQRHVSTTR